MTATMEKSECWQGRGATETLIHCWEERESVQLLWKPVWQFFRRLNIQLASDPEAYPK